MLIVWLSIITALIGLGFAGFLAKKIIDQKVEDKSAEVIASYIHKGAMAFLSKEYIILSVFVVIIATAIIVVPELSWKISVSFVLGSIFSALAGFLGMNIATMANVRTAEACKKSLRTGLNVAFTSGSVMGLAVVSLGLLGVAMLYVIFRDPEVIYGFGFGASVVALFSRVGGGIYTKAADIGADLVGKMESSLSEDDHRNPASIADNVGDNVGDVAGMGSDLFGSYVSSIIAAMVLGTLFLPIYGSEAVILPLLISGIGIMAAILGNLAFKYLKGAPDKILNNANWITSIITVALSFIAVKFTVGDINIFWAIIVGLVAGIFIELATEHYTSENNKPVREIAIASQTGSATNIITGLSVGFLSTILPVISVVMAIYLSYWFAGLYGVAMATVGMLSTLGMSLAADAYGPVVDNAAGIAQMAGMGTEVHERAEELDAVGNTTAAVGKGFAIGSAALTSFVLLVSFGNAAGLNVVNLMDPQVVIGLFLGGLLPFVFSALTMKSVGKAASKMVDEVRRQFREIDGLMSGQAEPDYKKCIDISTTAALREMILPGVLAIVAPIIIGFWLGTASLAGLLAGATVTGFLLAVFMANAGGAWDNAKKYIEAGHLGGKESDAHKASITGDTVGDPFKDTSGPSLNILIKLMAIISIIIVPLLIK